MCGIVGLFLKTPALGNRLGALTESMLVEMTDRGPDSAGFAVYRNPEPAGVLKLSLYRPDAGSAWQDLARRMAATDWVDLARRMGADLGGDAAVLVYGDDQTVIRVSADIGAVMGWLDAHAPDVRVNGFGRAIEVYKQVGLPHAVAERYHLARMAGSHALGHTRMATESAVTTQHSHPFATGTDLCLVHNGSLSNHNRLRDTLRRHGVRFGTDNDSEVAAGYLAWQMQNGLSLAEAMTRALDDLDGFYTLAVSTADGFAVLRDPIACKPAVMAETDDWVAMASEYRAIAPLPGADRARVWEPAAGAVYAFGRA